MVSVARRTQRLGRPGARLSGIDLARALAMLGMLVEHSLQYPTTEPKSGLWSVYGRSAPLFVLLAGVGVSLATRAPRRPWSRAMVVARAALLLLVGMWLTVRVDGVILQSFALFFVVGACTTTLSRRVLGALTGVCLVGGPLFLTVLRRAGELHSFGTRADVGFAALHDPLRLSIGLSLQYYPAVIWLGFFFLGMLLGRADVSSADAGRRLFAWSAGAAAMAFTVGWAGAHAFGPGPRYFELAPPSPVSWSEHWTTYGFSNALGWSVSSAALALAVTGACVWISATPRARRVLSPFVALGAMSLSFYLLQFLYLDTVWPSLRPELTTLGAFLLASVTFWVAFALIARVWLAYVARGPFETVLHAGALTLLAPFRLAREVSVGGAGRAPGDEVDAGNEVDVRSIRETRSASGTGTSPGGPAASAGTAASRG